MFRGLLGPPQLQLFSFSNLHLPHLSIFDSFKKKEIVNQLEQQQFPSFIPGPNLQLSELDRKASQEGPGLDVTTAAPSGSYQGFHQLGESSLKKKVVVQLLSHVQCFATPWIAARQASLSFTISWSLL